MIIVIRSVVWISDLVSVSWIPVRWVIIRVYGSVFIRDFTFRTVSRLQKKIHL